MITRIQHRRGTWQEWRYANPVLASGEIGYETDTNKWKIGNGTTNWVNLTYMTGGGGYGARTAHTVSTAEINYMTPDWRILKKWNMSRFYDSNYRIVGCHVCCGFPADGEWKVKIVATGIGVAPDKTWYVTIAGGETEQYLDISETLDFSLYLEFTISACLSGDIGNDNPEDVNIEVISYGV